MIDLHNGYKAGPHRNCGTAAAFKNMLTTTHLSIMMASFLEYIEFGLDLFPQKNFEAYITTNNQKNYPKKKYDIKVSEKKQNSSLGWRKRESLP